MGIDTIFNKWESGMSREELISKLSDEDVLRLKVHTMDSQINNGGFSQWWANGYLTEDIESIYKLVSHGAALGIAKMKNVQKMLASIMQMDIKHPLDFCTYYETEMCRCGGDDEDCWECGGTGEIEYEVHEEAYFEMFEDMNLDSMYYELGELEKAYEETLYRLGETCTVHIPKIKPVVKMINTVSGNIFSIIGTARNALIRNKQRKEAKELVDKVTGAKSYDEALCIVMEYVTIT